MTVKTLESVPTRKTIKMKKLLTLLFMCLAVRCMAESVDWVLMVGMAEMRTRGYESMITDGDNTMILSDYLGDQLSVAVLRVRLITDSSYLDIYDPKGVDWWLGEDGIGFYGGGSGYKYARFGIQMGNRNDIDKDDPANKVIMEIGIWPWEDDNPTWVAISDEASLPSLSDHIYERFDMNPLDTNDWAPALFYSYNPLPVPEPSIPILIILGACTMLLKRK